MTLLETIQTSFRQRFGAEPAFIARAPGRVNLLGEHVDYNGGFVLPAAIDRATYVAFSPSDSDRTTLVAADFAEEATFTPASVLSKTAADGAPLAEWAKYPAGVLWALGEAGLAAPALNAVFASDVPRGSGLSSSASVELAFGVAWQKLGGWSLPPMELALLGQKAENKYVGVNCGIMDQFASACGQKDKLLYLDCRALTWETVPLPENVAIVVADTTVRRKLTSGEYNKRRNACEEAVRLLEPDLPGIRALRDVRVADFNRLASKLPEEVEKRARHVVEEVERSQNAVALLENGNVAEFGRLMNACHASLRDLYEVSCPELDVMARVAQSLEGCYGARLTGAGFGGCTVNLVAREQAGAFAQSLAAGYESATGLHPEIYVCQASAGAGCF
jgi:galactokinase